MTSTIRSTVRLTSMLEAVLKAVLTAVLAAVSPLSAVAQTTTSAAIDVPAMSCANPGSPPIDRASPDMTRFQKRVEEYKVCVNTYAASTGGKANEYANQSRAWSEAANKAIDDYNAYVTKLNDATKSNKSGTERNTRD